jgi:hypothetical protein
VSGYFWVPEKPAAQIRPCAGVEDVGGGVHGEVVSVDEFFTRPAVDIAPARLTFLFGVMPGQCFG